MFVLADDLQNVAEWSGNDALMLLVIDHPHHAVGLPTPRLPICKDSPVVPS